METCCLPKRWIHFGQKVIGPDSFILNMYIRFQPSGVVFFIEHPNSCFESGRKIFSWLAKNIEKLPPPPGRSQRINVKAKIRSPAIIVFQSGSASAVKCDQRPGIHVPDRTLWYTICSWNTDFCNKLRILKIWHAI